MPCLAAELLRVWSCCCAFSWFNFRNIARRACSAWHVCVWYHIYNIYWYNIIPQRDGCGSTPAHGRDFTQTSSGRGGDTIWYCGWIHLLLPGGERIRRHKVLPGKAFFGGLFFDQSVRSGRIFCGCLPLRRTKSHLNRMIVNHVAIAIYIIDHVAIAIYIYTYLLRLIDDLTIGLW